MNSIELIIHVWTKAQIIQGNDPAKFRKDRYGWWIALEAYGDTNHDYGWEIDHIVPLSIGGKDHPDNMQPLHWKNNRAKSDKI